MKQKIWMLMLLAGFDASAQDIHYSQFYETAILRNPALVGIYSEDYKVAGQYRKQWEMIGKGFRTGQLSGEVRFAVNPHVHDYLSVGLLIYSDKAGRVDLRTTGIYPAINYNKSLEDDMNSYLSLGFTGGHVSRSVDVSKMTFDNQYQNGSFNSGNGSGETELPQSKINQWDLGAGISFNSSPSDKVSYYLGFSAYHFTKPKASFYVNNDAIRLDARWNGNAGLSVSFDDAWSMLLHGNLMMQGSYREIMAGGLLRWKRMVYSQKSFGLALGGFYRVQDAIIPVIKMDWRGQSFSFSYDINTSTLRTATNTHGGFEITVSTAGFIGVGPEDKKLCPRL